MLEHQYYALAACLVLFAAALACSAGVQVSFGIKEKEEAKPVTWKKMQSTGKHLWTLDRRWED